MDDMHLQNQYLRDQPSLKKQFVAPLLVIMVVSFAIYIYMRRGGVGWLVRRVAVPKRGHSASKHEAQTDGNGCGVELCDRDKLRNRTMCGARPQ